MIVHAGTAAHGHYYSLISTRREPDEAPVPGSPDWGILERGRWKKFDDRDISAYQISDLQLDTFGDSGSYAGGGDVDDRYAALPGDNDWGKNAYMLVYERKRQEALECVVSAVSRAQDARNSSDL